MKSRLEGQRQAAMAKPAAEQELEEQEAAVYDEAGDSEAEEEGGRTSD